MALTSEERQLRDEKVQAALEAVEEKGLVKWYGRWRNEPWTYAVVKTLEKVPYTLLVVSIVSWEKTKLLFSDPVVYVKDRGPMLLVAFFCFIVIFHFAWKSKAFKYFLLTKLHPHLQLHGDDKVKTYGSKASEKLVIRYRRWGQKRWLLAALLALLLPVAFFVILYISKGLTDGHWSWNLFFYNFEGGTDVAVFAIFFLFGALMGHGIWREINDNFQLMQKGKSNSEF